MDNLLPFLPRIAHIEPLKKRLIYVAGIKDAKIKSLNDQNKTINEYKVNAVEENSEKGESEAGFDENILDTWA
ncbi:hypothetical protein CJF42_00130 [Pseudoalteromonas sp. NBT06-2]|uniref:hypothetical protein n=1 Tax=Pseudoalteromonas sp. NBT06-2 TaxID=2025950 RepID=UPI000BA7AE3F|nr:hypothetical protein [Pseudoalteromonas sp. NBT06-2]PAJ76344.1 hypothetical protein CJF42_00130 [Pseudoalteromonas sp. NBT06-2]